MSDNSGFVPTVIEDFPIPMMDTNLPNTSFVAPPISVNGIDAQGGIAPNVIKDTPISSPPIAIDVISTSLDTQQRKVLGVYTFGSVGAMQVGKYINGVSGELDLSPSGLTAKNVNGVTTFSIDGTTGNATFLGTLQAGTLIAGDSNVIIGLSGGGKARILLSNSGVPAIVIGDPS